jgi:hypothetical protein
MQEDRQKMEQQQSQDMAANITQAAEFIHQMMMQGVPPEQIQAAAYQPAQQMLQPQQEGAPAGGQQAPMQEVTPPQGVTGQLAMANMARGM